MEQKGSEKPVQAKGEEKGKKWKDEFEPAPPMLHQKGAEQGSDKAN